MSNEPTIEPFFPDALPNPRRTHYLRTTLITLFCVIGACLLYIQWLQKPPADFPVNQDIVIVPGTGIRAITTQLEAAHVIKSRWLLYAVIAYAHNPSKLKASTYHFTTPLTTSEVALKLTKGDFSNNLISFTHIEGESVEDAANRASALLTNFDTDTFIRLGTPFEGKLFPDTYRIPKDFTARELLALMQKTFEEKITPLQEKINASPLTENDIITLASILEREANSPESMHMVSGILQNRLKKKMYLQVDASLEYSLHKTLQELTAADLEIDSPYNTYTNPGLPPTPIGNPGLVAITAVLEPTLSDNFFYITDPLGVFHYSKTFEEHKINVARYLK